MIPLIPLLQAGALDLVSDLAPATIVSALLVYLLKFLTVDLKNQIAESSKEITAEVSANRHIVLLHMAAQNALHMSLRMKLQSHDAQVRGFNPSVDISGEERDANVLKAIALYREERDEMTRVGKLFDDIIVLLRKEKEG